MCRSRRLNGQEDALRLNGPAAERDGPGGEAGSETKSTFDTKFKATIAKRYEAETGNGEAGETATGEGGQKDAPSSEEAKEEAQEVKEDAPHVSEESAAPVSETQDSTAPVSEAQESAAEAVGQPVYSGEEQDNADTERPEQQGMPHCQDEPQAINSHADGQSDSQAELANLASERPEPTAKLPPLASFDTFKKPLNMNGEDASAQSVNNSAMQLVMGQQPRVEQLHEGDQQTVASTLDLGAISQGNAAGQMASIGNVASWQYENSFFDH